MSRTITISAKQLRARLFEEIQSAGSYRKFAQLHGMSSVHYWNVVRGRKEPGPQLLKVLGYEVAWKRYRKLGS